MKKIFLIIFSIILFCIGCNNKIKTIEWISSDSAHFWHTGRLKANNQITISDSAITIFMDKEKQIVDGFGGCFNELGWDALSVLSSDEKEKIMRSLFDTISGCKFNICRMPVGANDYAINWYSCDEIRDDFEMKNFSINRDQQRLIPYIKKAKTYNFDLKIWVSPWSPPAWMKVNNHYACSPDISNDLPEAGKGSEMQTQFKMEKKYLNAYALYLSKFIQAYKNEGIDIYAVHVQNEPNSCQNFPSCVWTPSALATFIGGYLGPQFEKDKLKTEIWLGTIERPQFDRVEMILKNKEAIKYIKGLGFQWAGKEVIADVHRNYPSYKLMQTETECGNGANDWKAAEHTFDLIRFYFNHGANVYMYWNMILNETGKSNWGWKQNSMITVDSKTRKVTYNPEYYLMKHFSSFVNQGAAVIETSDKDCLAFKNKGSIIIVYYNNGHEATKTFKVGALQFTVVVPEKSFNTFKIII